MSMQARTLRKRGTKRSLQLICCRVRPAALPGTRRALPSTPECKNGSGVPTAHWRAIMHCVQFGAVVIVTARAERNTPHTTIY